MKKKNIKRTSDGGYGSFHARRLRQQDRGSG